MNDDSLYTTPEASLPAGLSDGNFIITNQSDNEDGRLDIPALLPVLPVRDVVLFNYTILPLFVGRDSSIQAVTAALNGSRYLYVVTQKDEQVDDPKAEDLHSMGTVVMILRMLKLPDGRLKLLVQGVSRGRTLAMVQEKPYLEAEVLSLPEEETVPQSLELEALVRAAREQSEHLLTLRGMATPDVLTVLSSIEHPGRLSDLIASNLRLKMADAQALLECLDPLERLRAVNLLLAKEAEVASMQAQIQESAREGMDKAQREYFLREQLKAIRRELGYGPESEGEVNDDLAKALKDAKLPPEVKKEADKQLKRLLSMHSDSSEANVVRTYLEWLAELPWAKLSADRLDIKKAFAILEEDHYGLKKVKERIIEFLSVHKLNKGAKSPIICFVGPPGVGKTSLGRSIARAMGRKFERISLGGMRDEAEIRGHRRTYVGAMPGRIIQCMKQAGKRNPLIMLDEIDKLGSDFRGDPSSALLEVLDPEQNVNFSDHYLNVPFDLSKVMFICTANNLGTVPRPLLDRMEVIELPGYTSQEKLEIAKRYLLDRQAKDCGLKKGDLKVNDDVIEMVISKYTREAGVRNLERELGGICRKIARKKAEGEKGPFTVPLAKVPSFLGIPKFDGEDLEQALIPGVALGLAWTPVGGDVLHVEVTIMEGKGGVLLTGQLGDVMKESAQAAVSYARTHAHSLGIDPKFHSEKDIHVHVPAGATPKDGPSAGVTLATALVSALTGKSVAADICMTGELTLRGRVMPVGGIKEKILAAVTQGLKRAVIPRRNLRDLEDIPKDLLNRIKVYPADVLEDVLKLAFEIAPEKTARSAGGAGKKNKPSPAVPTTKEKRSPRAQA